MVFLMLLGVACCQWLQSVETRVDYVKKICYCVLQTLVRSQNHGNTEWLGWKGPQIPPSPNPCHGQVASEPKQAAQDSPPPGLRDLWGWGIHSVFCTAWAITLLPSE